MEEDQNLKKTVSAASVHFALDDSLFYRAFPVMLLVCFRFPVTALFTYLSSYCAVNLFVDLNINQVRLQQVIDRVKM